MAPLRMIVGLAAIPIVTLACFGVFASYLLPPDQDKHYQIDLKHNVKPPSNTALQVVDSSSTKVGVEAGDAIHSGQKNMSPAASPAAWVPKKGGSMDRARWDELELAYSDVGKDPHASNECLFAVSREAGWENPR
jgi:hypothetical protein